MSAQVVLPQTKLPQHSRVGSSSASSNKPNSASSIKTGSTTGPNRFNRYRPPRKPEIQVDKNELKQKLTPLQYKVTQEKFTERAFTGEYLRLNDRGIYCCVVCNEELFSSETKYDSGCGWPAFFNTIDSEKLILQTDLTHVGGNLLLLALNQDLARTEVTCAKCGSHLGHVFDDGPKPTGKRYCVNSASLKFRKTNGEEVICDIPTSSSCCFRSPNKTSATTPTSPTTTDDATLTGNFDDNNPNSNTNPTPIINNVKKKEEKDGKLIRPVKNDSKINEIKCRLQSHINGKQNKTKSLSPVRYQPEAASIQQTTQPPSSLQQQQPIYSSLHAKRVQMNREDFFKSTNTTTSSNNNSADKARKTNQELDKRLNSQLAMDIAQSAATGTKPVLNRFLNKKNISDEFHNQFVRNDLNNNRTITNKYSDVKSRYLDHLDTLGKKSVLRHTTFGGKKSSTPASTITSAVGNISASTPDNNLVLESDL